MPQFSAKRRLPHSAEQMFDLVADVERYPQFVPLCAAMRILAGQKSEQEKVRTNGQEDRKNTSPTVIVAEMTVAYKLIRQTFVSRVTLDRPNLKIIVDYLEGPFRHMQTRWAFWPVSDSMCEIEFFTEYEFKSRTLAALMGVMFDAVFRRMVTAFEQRATVLYGLGKRKREAGSGQE